MDELDERIHAWDQVARHPFFAEAYGDDSPLIDSFIRRLDQLMVQPETVAVQAEEPVECRVLRAFTNGYSEGIRRGSQGRLDH